MMQYSRLLAFVCAIFCIAVLAGCEKGSESDSSTAHSSPDGIDHAHDSDTGDEDHAHSGESDDHDHDHVHGPDCDHDHD